MTYDPFFRPDNFKDEPWYEQLQLFRAIGVCTVDNEEYVKPLRKALKMLGYETGTYVKDSKYWIVVA